MVGARKAGCGSASARRRSVVPSYPTLLCPWISLSAFHIAILSLIIPSTQVDGLVLSLTPNTHSYNYRSAVLHGVASLVTDAAEKLWAMELITNSVCPGRWQNSRVPPDAAEMSSTQIMRVKVENGSAKVREGIRPVRIERRSCMIS